MINVVYKVLSDGTQGYLTLFGSWGDLFHAQRFFLDAAIHTAMEVGDGYEIWENPDTCYQHTEVP